MSLFRNSRPLGFCRAVWVFPAAFAFHVLEEVPGFTKWAKRYASERYTQRDFARNNAAGLAMTLGATWTVWRWPRRPVVFVYFAAVLTQQVPFNAAFHAGTTVAWRAYSPGVVTALAQVPLWLWLTRLARRDGLLTRRGEWGAAAIGGTIHTTAVAQQVFFVRVPRNPDPKRWRGSSSAPD